MSVEFKIIPHGGKDYLEVLDLRYKVLIGPAGLDRSVENPAAEKEFVHVAGFDHGRLVATAMLVPKDNAIKIQRVAVSDSCQSQGIGTAMMRWCENYAKENGYPEVYVHARDKAIRFYDKNGYRETGDWFIEDTIPHLKMIKSLA